MTTARDEDMPGAAKTPGRPVHVELAYAWGHWPTEVHPLDERIILASHKPLGAHVLKRTPEGWRWVPGTDRVGPKMALVAEYVADNPGCCKADAACYAGLYMRTFRFRPVERAISAGLITAEYAHPNRFRLFACGFDRRAYYGEVPVAAPDGYWHPGHP